MTGCTCHDPVVFGHGDFCEDGLGRLQLRTRRARGEGTDRALDRRLRELRADQELPRKRMSAVEWNSRIMARTRFR